MFKVLCRFLYLLWHKSFRLKSDLDSITIIIIYKERESESEYEIEFSNNL